MVPSAMVSSNFWNSLGFWLMAFNDCGIIDPSIMGFGLWFC